jgi:hypothetical protein
MDIEEERRIGGWINAFAISLTIWMGIILVLSLL